jgi:predicted metal-dependent hydrolase
MPPRKRRTDEIEELKEPELTATQREHFAEGIALFNAGRHWHAHEAWEQVWLEMSDGEEDDAEIILRGLIQLAAGLHLLSIGRLDGAASNFRKAYEKLSLAPAEFLKIDMRKLLEFLRQQSDHLDRSLSCTIDYREEL